MEILILHLVGDYLLQSDWMAMNKTKAWLPAIVHAMTYSMLFFLVASPLGVVVIFATHALIDRFRLSRYWTFAYQRAWGSPVSWASASNTGYSDQMPPWLSTWLMIIGDNTWHLAIAYVAVHYL
jgi:hypothetical protein